MMPFKSRGQFVELVCFELSVGRLVSCQLVIRFSLSLTAALNASRLKMPIWRLVHGASGCPAPSGTMSHQPIIICSVFSILWTIKGKGKSGLQCSSSALDARDPGWSRWDLRSNTVWEGTQISTLGHFFSGNFSFPYPGKSKISFEFGGFHWKCVPNTPIPS